MLLEKKQTKPKPIKQKNPTQSAWLWPPLSDLLHLPSFRAVRLQCRQGYFRKSRLVAFPGHCSAAGAEQEERWGKPDKSLLPVAVQTSQNVTWRRCDSLTLLTCHLLGVSERVGHLVSRLTFVLTTSPTTLQEYVDFWESLQVEVINKKLLVVLSP